MDELPIYSNDPRVRCKTLRGPWQEVQINAHSLDELDTPQFREFLEQAVQGFFRFTRRAALNPEDHMPWKKLGRKWHFHRKGFPPSKRVLWEPEVLEELCELLSETAPGGQFLWNNQVLVHYMVRDQQEPWATLQTKRPESLNLVLRGPKGCVTFGRVARLARARELDASRPGYDSLKLAFRTLGDLSQGDLREFLKEHVDAISRSTEAQ
jgi:excinuclease ABC subunit A